MTRDGRDLLGHLGGPFQWFDSVAAWKQNGRGLFAGPAIAGGMGSGGRGGAGSDGLLCSAAATLADGRCLGIAGPQSGRARPLSAVQRDPLLGAPGGGGSQMEPAHDSVRRRKRRGGRKEASLKRTPFQAWCAGVCCYEGHGGMCSIRLSEPLLKLRPRKDLVETLLHEMIHALLFVTNNDKDRESHGPEFCKHMHRINRLTGANITIYHEFHDEVDFYRQHWWRCNGPCRNRKPYYGYVKRVMNRAPSANDYWWAEHQKSCGGTYIKVREPDNSSKKCKKKDDQAKILDDGSRKAHGSSVQSIIPFSGKGYILGGKRSESSLEGAVSPNVKSRELIQSQYHSPASSSRSDPKNEIKFQQNVSCTTVSSPFSPSGRENSSASSITFPRFSVANHKVYTNINGSPVKNTSLWGKRSEPSSTKALREIPHEGTSENTISISAAMTPRSQSPSQKKTNTQNGGPAKRARMEDSVMFVNYFLKKGEIKETGSSVDSTAKPAISETSTSDQNKNVCCPVCQSEVLETKINEHLDLCL